MRAAAGRRPRDDGHDPHDGSADVVDVSGAQTLLMRIVLRDPRVSVWAEAALIVVALAVATWLVYWLGGAPNTAVHAYYFPIIYAAVRFGRAIGLAAATLAGIVCGPFMPMHVDTGERQPLGSWLIRLGFFIAVSLVVYWLARQAPRPLGVMLRDVVWAQRLRVALRRGVVGAHFQPIVSLSSGESIGVEALCRWPDPRGGFYSPAEFIPAAERTGVIGELGRHMLMTAATQAAEWSARPGGAPMVTVNVSATQLTDIRFPRDLARAVAIDGFDPQRFCLEITETAIMTDPVKALAAIRSARGLGLAIALDDFGTGYSSLAYLKDFPIDVIKIDQSFVAEVERDQKTNSLILAIIEMAKVLGAVTVAEGIERESQLLALRVLGCDLGQGWYLGRPVPATDPGLQVGAYRVDVAG